MERQLALPRHRETAGTFRLWRMTVSIACFGIAAVTSAQAAPPQTDRVRPADTALVAWHSAPLPIASSGTTHQAQLDAVAAVEPKQRPAPLWSMRVQMACCKVLRRPIAAWIQHCSWTPTASLWDLKGAVR